MMARLNHPFTFRPSKHIYQIGNTKALASPVHAGQRLLNSHSAIPRFWRIQAGIAITAGLIQLITKIVQKNLAPAAGNLTQAQHGIEFLALYPFELIVTLR